MKRHYIFFGKSYALAKIVAELNYNKSTISYKLKWNTTRNGYSLIQMHKQYQGRWQSCHKKENFSNPKLFNKVKDLFLNYQ